MNQEDAHDAWVDPLFQHEGQLCSWVRCMYEDSKGRLWFGTNHYELMLYDGDSLQYINENKGLGNGRVNIITEDNEGKLWVGTSKGLSNFDGDKFINFAYTDNWASADVWDIHFENDLIWLATSMGVYLFRDGEFEKFEIPKAEIRDTNTIISYDRVSNIHKDEKGVWWFATDGFGICKYDGQDFTQITTQEGLPDNNVTTLFQDSRGDIWIGTMFGGISRFTGAEFINYTQKGMIDGVEAGGFFEDSNGDIWFAAENAGIYRYDGNSFYNYDQKHGVISNAIISILKDSQGRFWFGGWLGLFRFDGEVFHTVTKEGPWEKSCFGQ